MWTCTSCEVENEEDVTNCKNCRSPRKKTEKQESSEASGNFKKILEKFEHKALEKNFPEKFTKPAKKEKKTKACEEKNTELYSSRITRNELRMVLIGKTGAGKSATANTILGRKKFESKMSCKSVTARCGVETVERFDKKLVLVDTPGLFDTGMTNEKVTREIAKCVGIAAPGPHAFLLVVGIGRLTKEEQDTVKYFGETFGKDIYGYLIVVFTRKGEIDKEGTTFEEYIKVVPDEIKNLLKMCSDRCIAFDNDLEAGKSNIQVQSLLNMIDNMAEQNGYRYYTNSMFEEAEKSVIKRIEKIERELEERKKIDAANKTDHQQKNARDIARYEVANESPSMMNLLLTGLKSVATEGAKLVFDKVLSFFKKDS